MNNVPAIRFIRESVGWSPQGCRTLPLVNRMDAATKNVGSSLDFGVLYAFLWRPLERPVSKCMHVCVNIVMYVSMYEYYVYARMCVLIFE